MPKYKLPGGNVNGIDIGGAHFLADADGCITVPSDNYHTLLAPLGCELQPESAPVAEDVVAGFKPASTSGFSAFAAASDPATSE